MTSSGTLHTLRAPFKRTEARDPRYAEMGALPAATSLHLQLEAQIEALEAIKPALPAIERASAAMSQALAHDDARLIYVGAGTSGRLGVQDGVELTPTFNWPRERCVYLMAGGLKAVFRSKEGAEDNGPAGTMRIKKLKLTAHDVVIGVAASGTTPFAIAALRAAREAGAVTIAITNNRNVPLLREAQYPVYAESGPEVIAGSTRLKAGTVQKVILNMLSNQGMIDNGNVYMGRMINMQVSCTKLYNRALGMIQTISGCDEDKAIEALFRNDNILRPSILFGFGVEPEQAAQLLEDYNNHLPNLLHDLRLAQDTQLNAPPRPF